MTDNVRAITPTPDDLHMEMGVSTSQHVASTLYEDFLPELRGRQALRTWREMSSNDATVAAYLFAISMLVREVDWRVEPADKSTAAQQTADWLAEQIDGLAHPMSDTVGEAFTSLQYGFSFHEIVYQMAGGRVGWERFAHRPQDTLIRWKLDDHLRPTAFVQAAPSGGTVTIPTGVKGLLYRMDTTTPSGTPILRGAYRSWMLKKRAEEYLMIGMSRMLNGLPKATLPAHVLQAGPGDPIYDAFKKLVTRVKRDEQMGILIPSDTDENGTPLYTFDLVSPSGNPQFEQIVKVIRMFASDMTATVLAQFMGLGRDSVGSRALAEPQQELFQTALSAQMDMLQDALNRQVVRALFDLNPGMSGPTPRLVHGELKDVDMTGLAELMLKTAQAGAVWFTGDPDDPAMAQLKDLAGFDADTHIE